LMLVLAEPEPLLPHAASRKALPPKTAPFLSNARRDISKPLLLTESLREANFSVLRDHAATWIWNAVPRSFIIRPVNTFRDSGEMFFYKNEKVGNMR
jgi:hypothetical protein